MVQQIMIQLAPLARAGLLLAAALICGLILHYLTFKLFGRLSSHTRTSVDNILVSHARRPTRWLIVLFLVRLLLPELAESPPLYHTLETVFSPLTIIILAWVLIQVVLAAKEALQTQYNINERDNLHARRLLTQIDFLKKTAIIAIVVFAAGSILMTFPGVRQLGTSILASAGVIGIIVGFAAQRSLGTLFAGLQIAFTQPIRIDDVVIVENEWGRIEEITLTYVVVRIWDLRRLVLPISYFIEKPFQNWTRVSADLMGTVFLYTDYTLPVDAVRAELKRIVKDEENWDGKVCGLQVTDSKEHTLELRVLVSASDASRVWDLRCSVREKLVAFLRENYPACLPRLRAQMA